MFSIKKVYFIAPSFSAPQEEVDIARKYLNSFGVDVILSAGLISPYLFYANTDELRAHYLKQALEDPNIDAIWIIAGGYGASRIVSYLADMPQPKKKKLLIGFSDSTVLHLFLNQAWNWPSIHGPTIRQVAMKAIGQKSIECVSNLVKGGAFSYLTLRPLNSFANHSFLEGIIIGGNLTTVASGIGTFWQIRPKNKIIFLEEVDERGYKLDRMLTHLKQAHIFEEAKAIILGDFIGSREKDGSTYVDKVINEFIDQMRLPVYHLPHAGHGDENFPFPLNMPVKLRVLMDGK